MSVTVAPEAREAQRKFEECLARQFPTHDDPESAIAYAYMAIQRFTRERMVDALEHRDPCWVDAIAHACDRLVETIQAMEGELERPAKARFVPEAL